MLYNIVGSEKNHTHTHTHILDVCRTIVDYCITIYESVITNL